MSATTTRTTTATPRRACARLDKAQARLDQRGFELYERARVASETDLVGFAEALSEAAGSNATTGEPYYTPAEVIGWFLRAAEMGALPRRAGADVLAVFRCEKVPNARLREEYLRRIEEGEDVAGLTARLARAIGATQPGKPDTSAVLRALGETTTQAKPGYADTLRLFCSYEQAVAMADVLDLDYHEIGV